MLPPLSGPGAPDDGAASELSEAAGELARRLDALVLVGGADVDPSAYDRSASKETTETHPWRDENELRILECFLEAGKPVLGVCRGTQILNTFLGGTLHQHVPDVTGSSAHQPRPGEFGEVTIKSTPGSRVAMAVGESSSVLCSHHQAIDDLGRGLVVVARADDGVVEAVELDSGFVVGVQWHPEESGDTRLFRALVEAC
jgi:gamma-glutamyl-gamma-aminobutyrate hydrolase PuuD